MGLRRTVGLGFQPWLQPEAWSKLEAQISIDYASHGEGRITLVAVALTRPDGLSLGGWDASLVGGS